MNSAERVKHTRRYIVDLFDRDELICLCGLNIKGCGRITIGYYKNWERFFEDVERLNGRGDVYINLNRLNPDLYGRAADRYKPWSEKRYTADEVIWRPRLVIDLDPIRLSGINSTDEELRAALDLAPRIADYVETEFGEKPYLTTSGNGVQMIVKTDLPPQSRVPEAFLKMLDEKFSNKWVEVDTSCHDLARIVRLPGTLNCKGDDILERPRRYSLVLEGNHAN